MAFTPFKAGNMSWNTKLKKVKKGRAPRAPTTKTSINKQFQMDTQIAMENWWKNRLDERRVFGITENQVTEGVDYRGELPWPKFVSLTALQVDFQSTTNCYLKRGTFVHHWHKVSGIGKGKSYTHRVQNEEGKTILFQTRTFYDIEGLIDKNEPTR